MARRLLPRLCLVLALAGCEPASLLIGFAGAPPGPEAVERRPHRFAVDGRAHEGDLYLPLAAPARGGLVLVPGAAEQGKDDPRLVEFARRMAGARFAVLVPEIASMRALRIGPEDARPVADAILHHAGHPAADGAVGVVGISYAAAPAVLAALRPEVGARVRFLLTIGGYYDGTAAIAFFTTGRFRLPDEAGWRYLPPNAYGKWVFVRANLDLVESAADRARLAEIADRKLADLEAPIDDLARGLEGEGRAVMALLDNRNPDRVPALIAALPPAIRARVEALDLSRRDLSALSMPVLLLHGRDDAIVPYSESLALAAALPEGQAEVFLVDELAHVDLAGIGPGAALTMHALIARVLEERDRAR